MSDWEVLNSYKERVETLKAELDDARENLLKSQAQVVPTQLRAEKAEADLAARRGQGGQAMSNTPRTDDLVLLDKLLDEMGAPKQEGRGALSPFGRLQRLRIKLIADNAILQANLSTARVALEPFARKRLSTEPIISNSLYRTPEMELRKAADRIVRKDNEIKAARAALAKEGKL